MSQDLARAQYAKQTRERYLMTAKKLSAHFGRPIAELSREQVRAFVDVLAARTTSSSRLSQGLCALLFLYRRTLGRPEYVSFIKLPRRRSAFPEVLSLRAVDALLRAIRNPRYQAVAMVLVSDSGKRSRSRSATSTELAGSSAYDTAKATRRERQNSRSHCTRRCATIGTGSSAPPVSVRESIRQDSYCFHDPRSARARGEGGTHHETRDSSRLAALVCHAHAGARR